jgi:hypothetical protein
MVNSTVPDRPTSERERDLSEAAIAALDDLQSAVLSMSEVLAGAPTGDPDRATLDAFLKLSSARVVLKDALERADEAGGAT